jgi:hypothetical protein
MRVFEEYSESEHESRMKSSKITTIILVKQGWKDKTALVTNYRLALTRQIPHQDLGIQIGIGQQLLNMAKFYM